jgi:riboflavin transporter FmnP
MTDNARRRRLLLQPSLAAVLATAVGAAVGFAVYVVVAATADETFGDLAGVVTGLGVFAVVATVLWLVGLAWLARRMFTRGRRAVPVVLAFLAAAALAVVVNVAVNLPPATALPTWGLITALLPAATAPGLVFLLWDRRVAAATASRAVPGVTEAR